MINKKSSKVDLDEMQVQTRNKVGNQCFFMLFSSLLIDLCLGRNGVKWAASSDSIYVIIVLCVGYYWIEIVRAGAYINYSKKKLSLIVISCLSMVIIAGLILTAIKTNFFKESFNISYSGLLLLFIFFLVFIMISVVSSMISKRKNNEGND